MSSSFLPCKFEYLITIHTFIPLQNQLLGIVNLVAQTWSPIRWALDQIALTSYTTVSIATPSQARLASRHLVARIVSLTMNLNNTNMWKLTYHFDFSIQVCSLSKQLEKWEKNTPYTHTSIFTIRGIWISWKIFISCN